MPPCPGNQAQTHNHALTHNQVLPHNQALPLAAQPPPALPATSQGNNLIRRVAGQGLV